MALGAGAGFTWGGGAGAAPQPSYGFRSQSQRYPMRPPMLPQAPGGFRFPGMMGNRMPGMPSMKGGINFGNARQMAGTGMSGYVPPPIPTMPSANLVGAPAPTFQPIGMSALAPRNTQPISTSPSTPPRSQPPGGTSPPTLDPLMAAIQKIANALPPSYYGMRNRGYGL